MSDRIEWLLSKFSAISWWDQVTLDDDVHFITCLVGFLIKQTNMFYINQLTLH